MIDNNVKPLTASEALAELAAGKLTSKALVQACLARIAKRDDAVAAWAHLDPEQALAAARASDALRASGKPVPPLCGIPVAVKDVIDTADYPTEYGSPAYAGRKPESDAFIVSELRSAGAVILGKTVTAELAFLTPGETRNPRNPEHTPGGSSQGSAAAVADGQVPLAIGTQTAGSLLRPASYCGVIGFKPTFGYVSRTGVLAQSAPLDTIGGYAHSVKDIALLFDAIDGFDASDLDMSPAAKASLADALKTPQERALRFAFVRSPAWPQADAKMRTAFEAFAAALGARAEVIDTPLPPEFDGSLRLQRIIQLADIARNYGPIADSKPDQVSETLKAAIAEGRTFSAADYAAALAEREQLYDALGPIIGNHDAILTPAAPGPAPHGLTSTGSAMFNALWTYLGMPCISLPLLEVEGLPVGVQLTCARGSDADLLRAADWLMRSTSA
jgi:Asp-tRNA(Asn)/Glu-tRNA(Gln) amidotransferase A subunit family amidase